MKTYDTYINSGIDWLGEIPEHWEVKKLKYFGSIYPGLNGKKGDDFSKENFEGAKEFVPFTTICNYSQIKDERFQYVKISFEEKQNKVTKNDLLFLMSSETLDDIGKTSVYLLDRESYLNSFCKGFRISNFKLNSIFTNYLLTSKTYRRYFELCGRGFTRINIKQEYINDTIICLPPIHEQEAIATFLDEKCAKIDALLEIKAQQIEKLKELRQVKIHQAVTKGLNPNAEMRNSGIDWIGEIPKHWEVKRLKYLFRILKRIAGKIGLDVLSITQKGIKVKDITSGEGQLAMDYSKYQYAYKGDFAMNHMDLLTGWVDISNYNGVISPDYRVFELINKNNNSNYFLNLLQDCYRNKTFYAHGQGVSMFGRWRFPTENFNNFFFPIPPLPEQEAIVAYLDEATNKIDQAIAQKQKQIEKLKEYKQSLINDVVTGKVKVC